MIIGVVALVVCALLLLWLVIASTLEPILIAWKERKNSERKEWERRMEQRVERLEKKYPNDKTAHF